MGSTPTASVPTSVPQCLSVPSCEEWGFRVWSFGRKYSVHGTVELSNSWKNKIVSFTWYFSQACSSIVFLSVYAFLTDFSNLHADVRLTSLWRPFFLIVFLIVKQWLSVTQLLLAGLWSFTQLTSCILCIQKGKVCFWMLVLWFSAAEVWDAEVLGESCKLNYPHVRCEYEVQNEASFQKLHLFVVKIMTLNDSASHV